METIERGKQKKTNLYYEEGDKGKQTKKNTGKQSKANKQKETSTGKERNKGHLH